MMVRTGQTGAEPNGATRAQQDAEQAERAAPPNEFQGSRMAGAEALSYDEATRSVEAVFSTGAAVKRWGFIEELEVSDAAIDLGRVERGVCSLLDTHNAYELDAVLGNVTEVRVENGELVGKLTFSETDAGRKAEGMVARGEVKGISVGYKVTRWEITKEADDNQKFDTWRATGWELLEVSLVPVPADSGAGVRSAGKSTPDNGKNAANEGHEDMIRNQSGGAAAPANPAATEPAGSDAGTRQPSAIGNGPPVTTQRTHTALSSNEAITLIDQARSFGETVETRARELIAQNAQDQLGADAVRAAVLQAAGEAQAADVAGIRAGGSVTITADENDKFARGAANAIMQRAGVLGLVEQRADTDAEPGQFNPGEFRGMRMVDIAALSNERLGVKPNSRSPDDIVRAALGGVSHRDVNPQGLQGTADFSILLGNVVHQVLRAAYAAVPDTWRQFCAVGSVTDFRPHYRVRMSTFGSLRVVNESGEFENMPIADGTSESITAQTKGRIIALTRQAIVNDDLNAFSTLAVQLGRVAARTIEEDVYAALNANGGLGPRLSDGKTLFHPDHGNIADNPGELSVAALDALDAQVAKQKDRGGKEFLDLMLDILLVPRGLKSKAITINSAEFDVTPGTALQTPNSVRGLFSNIVATQRLESAARYYGFADPAVAPALEVAFLNGEQEPFIDQQDGFRTDGVEWKVRHDYGVGAIDYQGAITSAGA